MRQRVQLKRRRPARAARGPRSRRGADPGARARIVPARCARATTRPTRSQHSDSLPAGVAAAVPAEAAERSPSHSHWMAVTEGRTLLLRSRGLCGILTFSLWIWILI